MTKYLLTKTAIIICISAGVGLAQTTPPMDPKPMVGDKTDTKKRDRVAKPDNPKPGDPAAPADTTKPASMPPSSEGMGVSASAVKVPKGKAIKADGNPEAGEWDDAVVQEMSGGGQLFLKHDGKSLFVGVAGPVSGAAQILLLMGDSVYVLRSADALGTAVYKKDKDGAWQPQVKFDKGAKDAAGAEKYMTANSWMASLDPDKSAKVREYVIGGKFKSGDTPAGLKFAEADWAALELSE